MTMASMAAMADESADPPSSDGIRKDLYDIGEIPPLGHVPKSMHAWAIRRERHGEPETAMLEEVVPVPELDSHDVLVLVMACLLYTSDAAAEYRGVDPMP